MAGPDGDTPAMRASGSAYQSAQGPIRRRETTARLAPLQSADQSARSAPKAASGRWMSAPKRRARRRKAERQGIGKTGSRKSRSQGPKATCCWWLHDRRRIPQLCSHRYGSRPSRTGSRLCRLPPDETGCQRPRDYSAARPRAKRSGRKRQRRYVVTSARWPNNGPTPKSQPNDERIGRPRFRTLSPRRDNAMGVRIKRPHEALPI